MKKGTSPEQDKSIFGGDNQFLRGDEQPNSIKEHIGTLIHQVAKEWESPSVTVIVMAENDKASTGSLYGYRTKQGKGYMLFLAAPAELMENVIMAALSNPDNDQLQPASTE